MIYRRIVLTTLLIIIGACVLIADENNHNEKAIIDEQYYLSPRMRRTYAEQANNGDGDAAYKLGRYHLWYDGNTEKAIYLFEKGVQVDNMGCLFEFGIIFLFSSGEQGRIIALQCFNSILKEAENGNEEAAKYMSTISDEIKEEAKDVDNISDEKKEAAAKYMENLLDEIKKKVE